ncbi:hypothetical protein VIN01S_13110 [Vibrio inusitatus NBRC 102082]|uniref:Uncharacterized protein n=1 Tax=Vibrio inusitatus NBRC 102082 TaxID=1219070 RepID=A0A4Y3HTX8_9VIBR|nr:hypothetical protein VIN01S_13110 [Vibrio inusitatus NBRC 102082]
MTFAKVYSKGLNQNSLYLNGLEYAKSKRLNYMSTRLNRPKSMVNNLGTFGELTGYLDSVEM